ncbi:endonuclease domain-containing protein [Leifsonia sp. LS-T14]|uniref:endonuclease domain-containing protein n=1 Tax=unclassified Leifsonia TaxID=2663824 RepID=UPI0035A6C5DA
MPDGMFFSHTTAAALYDLPLPAGESTALHVSAPRHRRAPRAAGVLGHRVTIAKSDIRTLRGLPVPAPVEVFCQLGSMLGHDALVVVGDALVRRKQPLTTLRALQACVHAADGRPGIRHLREAVASVRARTDSPMETTLRLAIVREGLPEPDVNYRIDIGSGGVAHLDMAYPSRRIAIEYDGEQHRTDRRQFHIDGDRIWRIQSQGWQVIRVNRSHMADGAREAVRRVRLALSSMGRNTP